MSDRIVTVITCWTAGCEKYEEYFVGVHDTFDSACQFVNEAINDSGEDTVFSDVITECGLKSTEIYSGDLPYRTIYYIRGQYLS